MRRGIPLAALLSAALATTAVAAEKHWAFRPVVRPQPPVVRGPCRTPVDAYILSALEARGGRLNPEADRATLARRVSFGLTGLPPTTAEIDEFYVLPAHRHSGVGTALLQSAEAVFAAAGCTNVSLQLGRGNDAARAFYRRHGYRERDGYDLLNKSVLRAG